MLFIPIKNNAPGDNFYSFEFLAPNYCSVIHIVYSPDLAMWQFSCEENNGDFRTGYIFSGEPIHSEANYLDEWSLELPEIELEAQYGAALELEARPTYPSASHEDPERATDQPYFTVGRQYRRPCAALR
jgi:hypothetical protein